MESIAWNKAGIMKPNCQAFTVPQTVEAMKVLSDRSKEKNVSCINFPTCFIGLLLFFQCTLRVVDVMKLNENVSQRTHKAVLESNISLAAALANSWLSLNGIFKLDSPFFSRHILFFRKREDS